MFKKLDAASRKRQEEIKNMALQEKILNAEANIDYISMMSGIDMPSDESSKQEEGANNE